MPSLLVPDVTARTSEPNGDPEEPPAEVGCDVVPEEGWDPEPPPEEDDEAEPPPEPEPPPFDDDEADADPPELGVPLEGADDTIVGAVASAAAAAALPLVPSRERVWRVCELTEESWVVLWC